MHAEISFDVIMKDDMEFVEGTYRQNEREWQVFTVVKSDIVSRDIRTYKWPSGVTGISMCLPRSENLNKDVVLCLLADALGVTEWKETRGPDSMQLR